MNQREKNDNCDNRHDRLRHAQETGHWTEFPGTCPVVPENGGVVVAKKFRKKVQIARKETEHDSNT